MAFKKGGRKIKVPTFHLKYVILQVAQFYRYLSIEFTTSGTFSFALNKFKDQAYKALFKLRQLPVNTNVICLKLFDSKITTILSYCRDVWGPCKGLNDDNIIYCHFVRNHLVKLYI